MGFLKNIAAKAVKPLQKLLKAEANLATKAFDAVGLDGVGKAVKKYSDKYIDLQNKVLEIDAVKKYAKMGIDESLGNGDPLGLGGGEKRTFDKEDLKKIFDIGPATGWILKTIVGLILIVLFYRVYLMASPYKRKRR